MKRFLFSGGWISLTLLALSPQHIGATIDAPKADSKKKSPAAAPLSDALILSHLYLENLREAAVDNVAENQSSSQTIRDMAHDFMKDHTYLAKEMRAQAGRLGIKLSPVAGPRTREEKRATRLYANLAKLKHLSGKTFDDRYRAMMAQYHKETMEFIARQRMLLPKDSPIFSLLGVVLPKVQDHYEVLTDTSTVTPG